MRQLLKNVELLSLSCIKYIGLLLITLLLASVTMGTSVQARLTAKE